MDIIQLQLFMIQIGISNFNSANDMSGFDLIDAPSSSKLNQI